MLFASLSTKKLGSDLICTHLKNIQHKKIRLCLKQK